MNLTTIIVILIVLYVFKNMSTSKNPIYISNYEEKQDVDIVTPHFVYQALNQRDSKIVLVNVLSDKMKYKITLNGFNDSSSLTKQEFEQMLKNNKNQIPDSIDKVIIYCAAWSCSGAKNYYKKLVQQGVNVDKVVDYIGAIHEWATYAEITPTIFSFHSTETNQVLNSNEVRDIRLNTAHDYFVDNVLKAGFIKDLSKKGKAFKNYL
jgi:hypothetical protein